MITVGLGSEHSTLPDKGQDLCPDRAWCLSQGSAVARSPPHGWHALDLSENTMWAGEAFLVEEEHISVLGLLVISALLTPSLLKTTLNSTPMFMESELS